MLHNRQAPGRDFHKHFSLAQPVVIPTPQATRNPPPLPVPYKTGLKLAMRRREQPHLSLIPLTPPAPPRLRPLTPLASYPLPSLLCPPSTSTKGRLERHPRGREGHRQVSPWDARDALISTTTPPTPTPPALPSPMYCRTAGRQNPCLCPERCHDGRRRGRCRPYAARSRPRVPRAPSCASVCVQWQRKKL